jgi:AAA15 family ATPase/GTPase
MGLEMFGFEFEESEGTKKIFALSGPIIDTLLNGKVLFVDELDSRLHPKIIQYIIELFNSKEHNPNNAQLIFVSHNTNILNRRNFRRDQVWFVEKDEYGSSKLFSLIEYKVRNTASFDKDYLEGKYGAVPVLEDIDLLNGDG